MTALVVAAALVGALTGGFLTRIVYRFLRQCLGFFRPWSSFCPKCRRDLPWYETIPVVSFLALRGRCRGCRQRISLVPLFVELSTAGLFAFLAHRWLPGNAAAALTLAIFGVAFIICTFVDAEWRVIPWQLDIPGFLLAPVATFLVPAPFLERERLSYWLGGPSLPDSVATTVGSYEPNLRVAVASVIGAVSGAIVVALIRWAGTRAFTARGGTKRLPWEKSAMGFDDVRFMAMIGGLTGWQGVAWTLAASSIGAAVVGVGKKLASGRDTLTGRELAGTRFLGRFALRLAGAPASAPPEEVVPLGRFGWIGARLATSDSIMPYGPFLAAAAAPYIFAPEGVVALGSWLFL